MKTFHPLSWGKSKLVPGYDMISCTNAAGEWNGFEVMAFMKDLKEPWIAFKTMAVGAIPPADAFKYAFDNGADFVCAGMFEWQLVGDVNIALAAIKGAKRERRWRCGYQLGSAQVLPGQAVHAPCSPSLAIERERP
jgi:hypothetical protein